MQLERFALKDSGRSETGETSNEMGQLKERNFIKRARVPFGVYFTSGISNSRLYLDRKFSTVLYFPRSASCIYRATFFSSCIALYKAADLKVGSKLK